MIEFEQSVCDIAAVLLSLVVLSLVGLFVLVTCCSSAGIGRWDQKTWWLVEVENMIIGCFFSGSLVGVRMEIHVESALLEFLNPGLYLWT